MSDSESEDQESLTWSFLTAKNSPPNHRRPRPISTVKFIDDLTATTKAFLPASYNILSTQKLKSVIHAKDCEDFYASVEENARKSALQLTLERLNYFAYPRLLTVIPNRI